MWSEVFDDMGARHKQMSGVADAIGYGVTAAAKAGYKYGSNVLRKDDLTHVHSLAEMVQHTSPIPRNERFQIKELTDGWVGVIDTTTNNRHSTHMNRHYAVNKARSLNDRARELKPEIASRFVIYCVGKQDWGIHDNQHIIRSGSFSSRKGAESQAKWLNEKYSKREETP